ncbi:MAG: hypothetical protein RBT34_07830 [Anaerolineaceae bacterium]|jgi:cell division protein FtsW (lipid II flippase)|nr:hypothetical protein [Anaerolineaceae bacterium]
MQLWIFVLATVLTLFLANLLEKRNGYPRRKAVIISVVIIWATVILITLFTYQGI